MEYDINDLSLRIPERDERLAWLRANDPVHWDAKNGFWLVTRHADLVSVSKDSETFSSVPKGPWHVFDGSGVSIQALDGREHLAKRRIVSGLFTPRMVRRLEGLSIASADMVEVSPPFDVGGMTALNGATIMYELLCVMAGRG